MEEDKAEMQDPHLERSFGLDKTHVSDLDTWAVAAAFQGLGNVN